MEPKPVITYFGDRDLLGTVLQKKLQVRLKQLQLDVLPKEDAPSFSSLCSGVEFVAFNECATTSQQAPYNRPALHTFWTGVADTTHYRTHDIPLIEQWLTKCREDRGVECLIVYVVTAEVRAKRSRIPMKPLEERIKNDFKTKADDVITFRLSAADNARLIESYTTFPAKINSMCLTRFNRIIEKEAEVVAKQRGKRGNPEGFYNDVFLQKLDLAVCYEMTLQNEKALQLYTEAITDLEAALSMFVTEPPNWMERMCHAPCTSWDYPKLVWSQFSWQYLSAVRGCSSPLLHVRTFFLSRIAHLLFQLERAWTVSELVISTLHCMAREIKMLKLSFPAGAFDCWAYMTCNEAIQAFMALISPESLESATSSLLLVRAELWHYSLQKLQSIGTLCGVMPSSNKLNHDKVLVEQIISGVHTVPVESIPSDVIGIEDQGKKLIDILNERKDFQTEFLRLGEMVIGAFKYAGRRRMAFKVGTMIAQFHRDLGLVHEAEELLSDICKFYSEDQWTQLSTNAFSLLADCQMKLKLEDKYVTTMLLLSSLPPYPGASHDPTKWLNILTRVAHRSPYQKILNWEPLLQLVDVSIVGDKRCLTVGDMVSVQLRVKYLGPTEVKSLIGTVELRGGNTPLTPLTPSTPPQRTTSPLLKSSPTISLSSLANMDELDLSNTDRLPRSRPIGGEGKHRTTSQIVTHISSAEIAELAEGEDFGRGKSPDMLLARGVVLVPGDNRITFSGKVVKPGDCFPCKISLKWGCLDFVYSVTNLDTSLMITVVPRKINVDVLLLPEYGVFLAGYSHDCYMTLHAGADTNVPENALIRLDAGSGVTCSQPRSSDGDISFKLPALSPGQSHECHMTMSMSNTSDEATTQTDLVSWTHEMCVSCEWLSPVHVATLPLTVYQPFTVSVREHSAGSNTFLQLVLANSCPLPLSLRDVILTADLLLTQLHTDPRVIYPRETYSLLWLVRPATPDVRENTDGKLQLKYMPRIHDDQEEDYNTFNYSFKLSNMQTVFEVRAYVDPLGAQDVLTVKKSATLTYAVKNVCSNKKTTLPEKLNYDVMADCTKWKLQESNVGVANAPCTNESVSITLKVCPLESGVLPLPVLTLLTGDLPLTGAQVYNLSYGQMATVTHELTT